MHKEENYLGYILRGDINLEQKNTNTTYTVYVQPEDSKAKNEFTFIEKTEFVGSEDANTVFDLTDSTFLKAKTRIMLELFDKGMEYIQTITTESNGLMIRPMSDDMIQKWILKGLVNIRRKNPLNYKEYRISYSGFCMILGINENQFLFNASLLLENTCIETMDTEEHNLKNGGIYVTSFGVSDLDFISGPKIPMSEDKKFEIQSKLFGKKDLGDRKYNIAISYADKDKSVAEELSSILKEKDISVFLDNNEKEINWNMDFYDYLNYIYNESAMFCIILVSKNYAGQLWADHSRKFAQAKAYREKMDSILPVIIDDTKLSGLPESAGYFKFENNADEIVELAIRKINENY